MKLYHQCGHCTKWNLESFVDDGYGDGLILSPVHERRSNLEKHLAKVRKASLFDPQYYLPNSQKAKLHSYDFFPEVAAAGFSTSNFGLVARESARLCIEFQLAQDYEKIIIPARHFEQMEPKYTDLQDAYTVVPFLHEASRMKLSKDVILTLPLTSHMVENGDYRTSLLNWVTSYPEISGVYVIVECERNTKQVASESFLGAMLLMLTELRQADLDVVIGYTNTESLLYMVAGDVDITCGAYENTRMFSLDKFLENDEDRRGPKARIYLPGLLNWVQFTQAMDIRSKGAIWQQVYEETVWAEEAFAAVTEPYFNQPGLYKHHFECFSNQVDHLRQLSQVDRYKLLRVWIKKAISLNAEISDAAIDLERHGGGDHLQPWLDVLNRYYTSHLKP
jgi:hypothetical protein